MKEVNAVLYDFLLEHEVQFYTQNFEKNKTVHMIVFIPFYDLQEFVEIVGEYHFEEGGIEVNMKSDYIVVELNDIIESNNHYLSSYKSCVDDWEWKRYEDEIKI